MEKLKNIYLKITEDLKSRIHIFLIIRRRNRNIETDQIVEILVEILVYREDSSINIRAKMFSKL